MITIVMLSIVSLAVIMLGWLTVSQHRSLVRANVQRIRLEARYYLLAQMAMEADSERHELLATAAQLREQLANTSRTVSSAVHQLGFQHGQVALAGQFLRELEELQSSFVTDTDLLGHVRDRCYRITFDEDAKDFLAEIDCKVSTDPRHQAL